jgi:hypothetical protein
MSIVKFAAAQLSKGNTLLGGNIAFTHSRLKEGSYGIVNGTELNAAVNAGFFFFNKLAGGVRPGIQFSRYKFHEMNSAPFLRVARTFSFGPFVRYYFLKRDNKINLFGDADLLLATYIRKGDSFRDKALTSSLGAGVVLFLNEHVGIEGLLSYSQYAYVNNDYQRVSNFLQFKGGIQVYLSKTK